MQVALLDEVKLTWSQDPQLQKLLQAINARTTHKAYYKLQGGILSRKGKIMVGHNPNIRKQLIAFYHGSSIGGHSGISATLKRLKQEFYGKKMKQDVYVFVRECEVCQRCKHENVASFTWPTPTSSHP